MPDQAGWEYQTAIYRHDLSLLTDSNYLKAALVQLLFTTFAVGICQKYQYVSIPAILTASPTVDAPPANQRLPEQQRIEARLTRFGFSFSCLLFAFSPSRSGRTRSVLQSDLFSCISIFPFHLQFTIRIQYARPGRCFPLFSDGRKGGAALIQLEFLSKPSDLLTSC
ncbi:hypothetical protein ASPWEDRAFT_206070 [Aspergillus wentii DTO 134E9]|uniref:Uncharacterized protein n=1 Tax=Aspergillus wentii DTO 134E9 TaxID=1073089 RepID=A0A1L9RZV4_ASPWE|nr:uncharacterized protein ASPWEDRAFT_206070 [Aspergillus wentii DTO 134E9]OJJ40377.1 hypothetical protein ASPWEDRAFT_206070 [Aspergillus wentii DTO 134E9]